MADPPRSLPPHVRPSSRLPPRTNATRRPVKVRLLVADRRHPTLQGGWKARLMTTALLLSMAAFVAQGGWVAVQLIINPGSVSWLGWLMPEWNRDPLSRYQTLRQIQSEAAAIGLIAQAPHIAVNKDELLMPILSNYRCHEVAANCQQIVEFRIYRRLPIPSNRRESYLELVDRLTLTGPRELAVIAPLLSRGSTSPGTSRPLPLETVTVMQGAKAPGVWLNLSGVWQHGGDRIAYGQIVRYDRQQHRLYASVQWTSPAQVDPVWQQVTGSADPELVVNQTVGLEPDFKVYGVRSIRSANPLELKVISLSDTILQSRTYQNGLTLARHGLWTPALQLMQAAQTSDWSASAQAQLDVIALHAAVTKAQADRTWANPSQALTANLLDGRWTKALQVLQAALADGYEVKDLITANADRLWSQVEAALSVRSDQPDVQAWGTLILFAQQGRSAAIGWLQQRNPTIATSPTEIDSRLQQVLHLLNQTLLVADHPSRIIGTVDPIGMPNAAEWLQPSGSTLTKDEPQAWYRIQVDSFEDGGQWQRSPFNLNLPPIGIAQQLWSRLGLTADPQIQLIVWGTNGQPQTLNATIKAARIRDRTLQLLASGDPPSGVNFDSMANQPPPLAMTTETLRWVEPSQTTLADLSQQQPRLADLLVPILWQSQPASSADAEETEMLQVMGDWSVRQIDLTGNNQPETIVSLPADAASPARPRTLIFSDQGSLIYSELGQESGNTLTAIAEPENGKTALLVEDGQHYTLRQWSDPHQKFE